MKGGFTFEKEVEDILDRLNTLVESDLAWEKVSNVEKKNGVVEMVDYEVNPHHNYIVNGFATYNSMIPTNLTIKTQLLAVDGVLKGKVLCINPDGAVPPHQDFQIDWT